MDIDELKQAWQLLDRRLERQNALQLQLYRDGRLARLRRNLRPLAWGQAMQMIAGALLMLASASFWSSHRQETHLLVAGLTLHGYGLALLLAGGFMHAALGRIDHAAPVLEIQRQLAEVRRLYARSGIWLGLCWWLLWVPATMVVAKAWLGLDLYLGAFARIWSNLAVGLAGLWVSLYLHRRSRRSAWPRLATWMESSLTGASLRRSQAVLDEIGRFERD